MAGANAVNDINYQSIKEGAEYAGRVYQNSDGTYSYTPPNKGNKDTSWADPTPPGKTNAGDYHTHGAPDPNYYKERFSPTDKNANNQEGVPGYMGTPSGVIKKYDPNLPNGKDTKNLPYPNKNDGGKCQ